MQFRIENMTCSGCARSVTTAIRSIDPFAVIHADPNSRRLVVEGIATRVEIEAALEAAGFPAQAEAA